MNSISRRRTKFGRSEVITKSLMMVFYLVMAFLFLYPIIFALLTSLKTTAELNDEEWHLATFPLNPYFGSWKNLFSLFAVGDISFLRMLWNSIWYTGIKVFLNIMTATLLAYAVAKFRFPGRNLIYATVIFVMTIPIFGAGSTAYKLYDALSLVNNPSLFWISWLTGFTPIFLVLHGMFKGINNSYLEAARIDGAGNLRILFRVILPMAAPTLMALFVSEALVNWNDFGSVMIYLRNYPTISYGLYLFPDYMRYLSNSTSIYYAALIISMIPIALLYGLNQKLVMSNVTVGGLKG